MEADVAEAAGLVRGAELGLPVRPERERRVPAADRVLPDVGKRRGRRRDVAAEGGARYGSLPAFALSTGRPASTQSCLPPA